MTARYVALARPPRAWIKNHDDVTGERLSCVVFESELGPRDTGILDAAGVKLYAVEERGPIGFCIGDRR